jgi:thioredoxin-related protein
MSPKVIKSFLIVRLSVVFVFSTTSCKKRNDSDLGAGESEESLPAVASASAYEAPDKEPEAKVELEWMIDFDAAKQKAAGEGKDLLLNFSGSDWCTWCKRLDEEVFTKDAFAKEASKNFVFVNLDFPNDKSKQSAETQKQNDGLAKEYGVPGFPTVILTDKNGIPYAQTGYVEGGAEKYIEHLNELRSVKKQVDELIIKSEDTKIEETERAGLLDLALSILPPNIVDKYYTDKMDRIVELDAENKAGLKNKYLIRRRFIDVDQALQNKDYNTALQKVTAMIEEFKPDGQVAQQLYFAQAHAHHFLKNPEGERASLQKALDAAPEGYLAEQIKANLQVHSND